MVMLNAPQKCLMDSERDLMDMAAHIGITTAEGMFDFWRGAPWRAMEALNVEVRWRRDFPPPEPRYCGQPNEWERDGGR